jgi:nucleoside-diphosphate kinase
MERTLIILKPDAVQRQIIGEIISRFEKVGLKIVGVKMVQPDRDHYHYHYEDISKMISRRGEDAFEVTLQAMQEGPVIAMVLEGIEAITIVRKIVGTTEPKEASPGTIRGDYSHISFDYSKKMKSAVPNLVHASGNAEEANQEIVHWFSDDELFEYSTVHENFTHVKSKSPKQS